MASGFTDFLENAVLNHVFRNVAYTPPETVYVGLHTDTNTKAQRDAGTVTEISGGGYARVAAPFAAASGGQITNSAASTFPQATGNQGTATSFGIYDAPTGGNLLAWGELLGEGKTFTADAATDTITSTAHGLVNNTRVRVRNSDGALPGGLSEATLYYVVNAAVNTFQLALSEGGAAVDITSAGSGTNKVHVDGFREILTGDTISFAAGTLTISQD